jgi:hypothetical protein
MRAGPPGAGGTGARSVRAQQLAGRPVLSSPVICGDTRYVNHHRRTRLYLAERVHSGRLPLRRGNFAGPGPI